MTEYVERRDHTQTQMQLFSSFVLIFLIGLVTGVALTYHADDTTIVEGADSIMISMTIDYGYDHVQALPPDIISTQTTLSSYMRLVEERYGVPIEVREMGGVTYIEAVHGVHASEEREWVFYVNNTKVGSDPTGYILNDSDHIVWRQEARS